MAEAYAQLLDYVQLVRRLWRTRRVVEGLVLAPAVVIAVGVAVTIVDQVADFGYGGRWALAAILWLTVIGSLLHGVARPALMPHSDEFYAALMEQRLPVLGNRLINAFQLGRDENPSAPRLVEAIVGDGVSAAYDADPGRAVGSPTLRRNAIALAAVLIVGAVYSIWAGPTAGTSFLRVLLPGADIAPFTWTKLAVKLEPGDRLLEGTPLTVTALTTGRIPDEAALYWADARGGGHRLRMAAAGRGEFTHAFPEVRASLELYVTAGDARSETFRIVADRRPRIDSMSVTYQYPAYAGLEDYTIEDFDGHLHGLPGTRALLNLRANKPLERLTLATSSGREIVAAPPGRGGDPCWSVSLTLKETGTYRVRLLDTQGYEVEAPTTYTVTLERDAAPVIAFTRPGRDVQRRPEGSVDFVIVAQDDLGLGPATMLGRINDATKPVVIHAWPNDGPPQRRLELSLSRTAKELGLAGGDRLQYWARVLDRNPGFQGISDGPGVAETRRFYLIVLSAEQAAALLERQLADYAKVIGELIRLQRMNRAETAEAKPAEGLIERQGLIRRQTLQLADVMAQSAFPGRTIIAELRRLGEGPMAQVIGLLESYRDATDLEAGRAFASRSLPTQDQIVEALEGLLMRMDRNEQTRSYLKKLKKAEPVVHRQVTGVLAKMAENLDKFLSDLREIDEKYEKLPKRLDGEDVSGEDLAAIDDIEQRLDRWKEWFKDSVDAIMKLPQGFVAEAFLAENFSTIFEEIEKQATPPTVEIATPLEEGAKALAEEVAEDFEMWMPDHGDNLRWVMEEPMEGTFEVPEATLPSSLQDMIGDLIEDMNDFDEAADDITGAWGGNMQVGWGITDGPISSFSAVGKTGNQLPNASEMGGRAGSGRRGRSSGQMVGDTSRALEGRPTPARLTNEPYEAGVPKAEKQLNPRGATGGGKKTGGGQRGLQGGTPPDFVKDMERLAHNQALLREKAQRIARALNYRGRPLGGVLRAIELMKGAEQDYRDLRYDDAARKRKMALDAVRQSESRIDEAVSLSLQKAAHIPPEMRREISAAARQALPEGYEDIVGAYYKALSRSASE